MIWASQPFGFVRMPDTLSTGSSIMPQKKNPDAAELVRGHAGRIIGCATALMVTMKGLPLAYSKDMQDDKPPVFEAAGLLDLSLAAMTGMVADADLPHRADARRRPNSAMPPRPTWPTGWCARRAFRSARRITSPARGEAGREPGRGARRAAAGRSAGDRRADRRARVRRAVGRSLGRGARFSHGGTAPDEVRKRVAEARAALGMERMKRLAVRLVLPLLLAACGQTRRSQARGGREPAAGALWPRGPARRRGTARTRSAGRARTQRRIAHAARKSARTIPSTCRPKTETESWTISSYATASFTPRTFRWRGSRDEVGTPGLRLFARHAGAPCAGVPRGAGGPAGQAHIAFAVKANPNLAVLSVLGRQGYGADVVSGGEMARALAAGMPPETIVFSGVGKTGAEMAAGRSMQGSASSTSNPRKKGAELAELAAGRGLTARLRAARQSRHRRRHARQDLHRQGRQQVRRADRRARAEIYARLAALPGLECAGWRCISAASWPISPRWKRAFAQGRRAGRGLARRRAHGHPCRSRRRARRALQGGRSAAEPGRIRRDGRAGDQGLGRHADVRARARDRGQCRRAADPRDPGEAQRQRPAFRDRRCGDERSRPPGAVRRVARFRRGAADGRADDAPISSARSAKPATLSPWAARCDALAAGDLAVFRTAGAYGATMATSYNSRGFVPEVLVDGDRFAVVADRIAAGAIMAAERVPDWLAD